MGASVRKLVSHWDTPLILIVLLACLATLSLYAPGVISVRTVTQTLIWVVLVVGLYTFIGLSGVVSFGQTTFSTLAAYCVAWLTLNPFIKASSMPGLPLLIQGTTLPPLASAVVSIAAATAVGFIVSLAVMRLAGEAATIATFALLIIVNSLYSNWSSVTGGTSSIVGIPLVVGLWSALGAAALAILVAYVFQTSRAGVMLQASRDDAVSASASGIEVRHCQILAFTLSCSLMALGGVLQAHFLGVISVDTFYLGTTFMTLAMLVVGGRSSLTGAVIGALLLSIITSMLRGLEHGALIGSTVVQIPDGVQEVALGAVMLLMLIKRRRGLCGLWEVSLFVADPR
jgi:branched-chain amino acid transport system permease protein